MRRRVWKLFTISRALSPSQQWSRNLRPLSTAAPAAAGCGSSGVAVKKVTRSNFEPALEEFRDLVRDSDFVAFDLEMSGVTSAPWREAFVFDDAEVQYLKVKDSAEKFAVVQFGVCPFRWDHSKESFLAHPHNFYLFQRKELPFGAHSYEFLCQTTSMDFLAKHQFDFNACIHDGISHLSKAHESEIFKEFSLAYENKAANLENNLKESGADMPLSRFADILFAERIKNQFLQWRDGILEGSATSVNVDNSVHGFKTTFFKMRPAAMLDGFTSHQYNLIQRVIKKHFKDLIYTRVYCETMKEQKAVIYVASDDDKALLMREVHEDLSRTMKEKIRAAVGFRHVIDLLALEQKLLVGHSCILDIAHIHEKFIGPLPATITEFASTLHNYFPHIVDTKHILRGNKSIQYLMDRKSQSLSSIFAFLCPELSSSKNIASPYHQAVKVEVPEDENGPSWNSGANHDAGYDAFMTGCVFAQLCSFLGINFKLRFEQLDLLDNEKLQAHMNLLYPNFRSETVINLKTGTEVVETAVTFEKRRYPKVEFSNIVLLWGFPKGLKPIELKECICKVFGFDSVKSVFYLDRTAALIQFSRIELVGKFLLVKDSLERSNNVVSVLHPFAKILDGGRTRAAKYDTYREICSSPLSKVLFADQAEALGFSWMTRLETESADLKASGVEASASSVESAAEVPPNDSVLLRCHYRGKFDHHLSSIIDSLYAVSETRSG